jgi:putative oxidoreductase
MSALGLAVLRWTIASVLLAHGAHTMFGLWSGPGIGPGGLQNAAVHYTAVGLEPGFIIAVLAGVIQLVGALLLIAGFLTRWASAAVLGLVAIQIWKEFGSWGFFLNWTNDPARGNGFEYALLMAGGLICLIFCGSGSFSIDGRRASSQAYHAAARARRVRL